MRAVACVRACVRSFVRDITVFAFNLGRCTI